MSAIRAASPRLTAAAAERYLELRRQTERLAAPLSEADCQAQSMPEASPVKWHLAHVSWFFETFVLERFEPGFRPHHPAFRVLFNSYYQGVGEQHPRAQRGLVTRPGLDEVLAYRQAVDERMLRLLHDPAALPAAAGVLLELGLQHEQQHQELMLTDVCHLLSCNPLDPVYLPATETPAAVVAPPDLAWAGFDGGRVAIGHDGDGFAFDNEGPRHDHWLQAYALASRPVTQAEWAAFIADGGYAEPRWWLAAGWDWLRAQQVTAPLYWRHEGGGEWSRFTLRGRRALDAHAPVAHISLYEADAFAHWWQAQHPSQPPVRLPTEAEWEHAAAQLPPAQLQRGNFVESGALLPLPVADAGTGAGAGPMALQRLWGDVWEWTASAYAPYPGYVPWAGAVGEYNGKFMVNQYVLRGGSCATPRSHLRNSYRNFFGADARWQFSGVRLARTLG